MQQGTWSQEEHDRFLAGVKIYPDGPWRLIARYVGTRSVRQVQTHAQKYHEKIARRMRGLRKERRNHVRKEHRIDGEIYNLDRVSAAMAPPSATSPSLVDQFQPYGHAVSPFAGLLPPTLHFPYEERAHMSAHANKPTPTVQLPPLRFAVPPLANGSDDLPEEPLYNYLTHAMASETTSAVV